MSYRKVKAVHYAEMVNMGGFKVRQPLPSGDIKQIDPFLLLHHAATEVKAGTDIRQAGVGPHPHRGFSPVTFVFEGAVHHRDSMGNDEVVEAGGVQWLDAGRGMMHSERPSKKLAKEGGIQEIIQLWVNTPQKHKMDEPTYQALHARDIPAFQSEDGMVQFSLLAGEQDTLKGPVISTLPLFALTAAFKAGGAYTFNLPRAFQAFVYLLDGEMEVAGVDTKGLNLVELEPEGDLLHLKALKDTRFLLMAGQPLNEPLSTYGPFVMNSPRELLEAMNDYQLGKMGRMEEAFDEEDE